MSTQTSFQEKPTAKPVVAGIFNIVVGALCLFAALGVGIAAIVVGSLSIPFVTTVLLIILVPILVLGVVAVLGGVYATQRRMWGWALAGSIATALVSNVLGVASIVLVAVSKGEFADGQRA